jgi:hypothetical protein
MLWNASAINGYAIAANDGRLGVVRDFLFDDASWMIRWLVVDTGNWLSGRKVLLPPFVLGHPDPRAREFAVRLTMQQVKDSPNIDTEQPVSRQSEINVYDHYGWSPYWSAGLYMGSFMGGYGPMATTASPEIRRQEERDSESRRNEGDPHLRSIDAVTGYHMHCRDGAIGHVEDFLVGDADWSIHYLVVDTKNWWAGKKVLISPRSVREIAWSSKLVNLNVDRQKVKDSPTYEPSMTVDQDYENHFQNYYGGVRPSNRP